MPKQPIVFVTAAPGCRVPQENHHRRYYPDHGTTPLQVPDTPYLRRLIVLGDVVECAAPAAALVFDEPNSEAEVQ